VLGCQTQFAGSAHVDVATCARKCSQNNLAMAGMVYLGEYSSACICEVPKSAAATTTNSVAGAVGATAGVMMQMQREQARQQPSQSVQPRR
jgi:hypothetical protein